MKQSQIKQLTIIVLTLLSVTVYALPKGVNMNHSGEFNTLLTINPTERYLSLPIEEAAPEAFIRVIIDGVQVTTFNARLAADSIDYVVPFDMQPYMGKQIILDIHFPLYHYNKKHPYNKTAIRPDRRKFICWKEMQTSDRFVVHNREQWRSKYHHTPLYGWMNDPNGMFYDALSGLWHLYYQFNPYGSRWGNMNWGHSISADLRHWTEHDVAIAPDALGTIFSGSCVIDKRGDAGFGKNAIIAFYTGADQSQKQSMAYSVDGGKTFVKYDGNPVLTDTTPDFRDPKVWREKDGTFRCVVGACTADRDKKGRILYFRSNDGLKWEFVSILAENDGTLGAMWECPDFFELDGKYILMVNPQDVLQNDQFNCGNVSVAMVGTFDPETGKFTKEHAQLVDHGIDFYATQTLLSSDGRRIMTAWMQNWDSTTYTFRSLRWFGQCIIPRELSVKDGMLIQTPVREIEQIRKNRVVYENVPVNGKLTLDGVSGRTIDMTVRIRPESPGSYRKFELRIREDEEHYASLVYRPAENTLRFDRSNSGTRRATTHTKKCTLPDRNGELKLRIILDRYSCEVFINDGEKVMSNMIFTSPKAEGVSFINLTGSVFIDVEKYDLELD